MGISFVSPADWKNVRRPATKRTQTKSLRNSLSNPTNLGLGSFAISAMQVVQAGDAHRPSQAANALVHMQNLMI